MTRRCAYELMRKKIHRVGYGKSSIQNSILDASRKLDPKVFKSLYILKFIKAKSCN